MKAENDAFSGSCPRKQISDSILKLSFEGNIFEKGKIPIITPKSMANIIVIIYKGLYVSSIILILSGYFIAKYRFNAIRITKYRDRIFKKTDTEARR